MNTEQPQPTNEAAGGASDVERVVRPCNSCGCTRYEIQHIYTGYREKLLIVQCGDCKDRIIPVVVDYFMPQQDIYAKCETAWNDANAVPNAPHKPRSEAESA